MVFNLYWLVNPVLAAISILLTHAIFCRISDRGVANLVVALMVVSPWFIATHASQMSHSPTLTIALAAWLLLLKAKCNGSLIASLLAGGLMGFVFLTRFLDGVFVGILTGIWTLTFLTDRSRWRVVIGYGFGCIVIGALIFPYNQYLTGDPLLTTHEQYWGSITQANVMAFGFGQDVGAGPETWGRSRDIYPGHGLAEALIHFQHNTHKINFDLFGWTMGSLSFLFAQLVWGRWTRSEIYMAILLAATITTFSLFWFSGGYYFGARYWFLGLLPIIALSVSGVSAVARKLTSINKDTLATQRLGAVLFYLCVFSVISFLTWRGVALSDDPRKSNFPTDFRELLSDNDLNGSLVFVKARKNDLGSAFLLNSPDLSGPDAIFAQDLGAESNRKIAEAFPDRPIYFVASRQPNGKKAYIIKGPVSLDSLY
jgi:4-amino-4-deoxy-L-arabinose transferase-like glycosyltransferase